MPRPEVQAPPEIFYNESEARKYTTSSRIIEIQSRITERALELLALPNDGVPKLLLDIGCGSGLSGETLTEQGHHWIGYDISKSMLDVALEREAEGDLLLADMGQGLGLRPGVIDGAISISAVQWLCNADKSCHNPRLRLKAFFGSLYRCLARGARAVLQFYADNVKQSEMIVTAAMRAGFAGGVVVDWPHSSKAKKSYLVLTCGPPSLYSSLPKGKGQDGDMCSDDDESDDGSGDEDEAQTVGIYERNRPKKRQKTKKNGKGKAWLLNKKEQMRRRGREVPVDTKYTGRKRKSYFYVTHVFYNESEARKYTTSSRIIKIQSRITERALELLALPNDGVPKLLLDIGCGSGLSGETLTEQGHNWIGYDISKSMLDVALEREAEGDLLLADMGQGLGLRPGVIDGAISISAVQWLCNADKSCHNPRLRLKAFFGPLYRCLPRGARAVLQFYADNVKQSEMIVTAAMRAGFAGGVVVDWSHSSKAKKSYLVLTCGPPCPNSSLPKGKGQDGAMCSDDDESDDGSGDENEALTVGIYERNRPKRQKTKKNGKGKTWLLNKKEQMRRRGREVPADTKYTGGSGKATSNSN